jgi:kanamycin nucleotidyltransferase
MSTGPQPRSRAERLALAQEIFERVLALHGNDLLAVGLYGSMARSTDGPYSDLEVLCVLKTVDEDYNYEWIYNTWKAEVNFRSRNMILAEAAEIEENWPLTHGAFANILPLYDPSHFFNELKEVVLSHPPEQFQEVIRAVIVGELYEWMGKLRNAQVDGETAYLPELALNMAKYGAFILGLAHRHFYTTGRRVLEESLTLPGRPPGYDSLCQMAIQGTLSDFNLIRERCELFWAGVAQWAAEQGLQIEESQRIPF